MKFTLWILASLVPTPTSCFTKACWVSTSRSTRASVRASTILGGQTQDTPQPSLSLLYGPALLLAALAPALSSQGAAHLAPRPQDAVQTPAHGVHSLLDWPHPASLGGVPPSLPPTSCRHHAAASPRCVPGPCPPSTALFLLLHPPTTPCPTAAPSAGAVGAIL